MDKKQFDIKEIAGQDDYSDKSSQFKSFKVKHKKNRKKLFRKTAVVFCALAMFVVIPGGYMAFKANSNFDKMTGEKHSLIKGFIKMLPFSGSFFQIFPVENEEESTIEKLKKNKLDRLNVLVLGIRGVGDPNGGLLADTMMVLSFEPQTGNIALISIPRDLYVKVPHQNHKHKINETYVLGVVDEDWKKGLEYSETVVSDVTGLDIHYAASVDFKAFKEIIDILGGVTITLDQPFAERNQFAEGVIELPAGRQVIDGETALLFVRARFSTNDFDRAKRQQQMLIAIKDKAFGLGVLSNPLKIISILDSLGNHVKTDAELWEIQEIAIAFKKVNTPNIKRKVFDTSEEGLLYASRDDKGSYILLPEGDNFDRIQKVCREIFK
ncbi:MAG: LCP family protein [Candidatus Pacebacteria bacterium]|nr:LCP family protein [Candidatus Paceibacterota bacterium]